MGVNIRITVFLLMIINLFFFNTIEIQAYKDIKFKNITIEDGLSQATVETIYQDSTGAIWIGTNDGLNRYNGYEFKVYQYEEDSKNSIVNNYIVDIKEDKKGNLWVGTAKGISKINLKTEKITNYLPNEENGNLSHYNTGDILITNSGNILIGTMDGLNIYNEETDSFERVLEDKRVFDDQNIYSLDEDSEGNIWIGTSSGLYKGNIDKNQIYKFKPQNIESISNLKKIYYIYCENKETIWVGTVNNGLSKINTETNEVTTYKHNQNDKNSLPSDTVRTIFRDSKDNLWVGTDNGLVKYNEKDNVFEVYNNKLYDKTSVVDDEVFSIIEDSSGLIWVGTYAGISLFDTDNNIQHYKKDPFDKNSLSENSIHGIYEDNDGMLWVGTNSKGVNILNRYTDDVIHLNKDKGDNTISSNSINDITGIGDKIFIATSDGLNIIDKNKKKLEVYKKENGLSDNNIRTLYVDSKENLWIGNINGLNLLNTKDNSIIDLTYILENQSITDKYIGAIYEDSDGIYWIGSFIDGGILKIDPYNKDVKNYKNDIKDKSSISNNTIRCITGDDKGNLWVGTSYGLNKLDKNTDKFRRYTTKDGLANNTVYGILIDKDNNPWVSTNSGISELSVESSTFRNLDITDGLQSNEFNGRAFYKNNDGEFFFGGIKGLNVFKPEEIKKNYSIGEVVFDEFDVKGKKYKDINGMKFKHDNNIISIKVFLSDYKNIENTQYYYILEGSTNEWSLMNDNQVIYSDLSPGDYTFKIRARNYNGVISEESNVSFTIEPPLWMSGNAIFIYTLIVILIICLNINKVKRLDKLVEKRTEELSNEMEKNNALFNKVIELERNKNNYFINLSHELRTPLNVIYTTEQLITTLNKKGIDKEKLDYHMCILRKNTKRLLNLINNLIDTTKIEHGNYRINITEEDIVYIVEETALAMKDYVESKGIELIIDPEVEEKIIECDASEIERCIVNLVGNAAKFTKDGGKIEVNIKDLGNEVMITVSDTGIGIDPKYHDTIFDRFNQVVDENAEVKGGSGLGLTITKHIIDLHNGKISVDSKVNEGTKFIITLPDKFKK